MPKSTQCPRCKVGELQENSQGERQCNNCGNVIEGVALAQDVGFLNSGIVGGFVNLNEPTYDQHNYNNERDTVQKRLDEAQRIIEQLKTTLDIKQEYENAVEGAMRVLKIADQENFFGKGRKMEYYAAAAYYIILRNLKAPYLLIDFSDKLGVNLFKLARCFLRFVKFLGLQERLPLIEPSIFILRYCIALKFDRSKIKQITTMAINLVRQMKKDWMSHGRRPSSLCGAAILIAAKIHDVPCTTKEICQTVYVCDETIKRRLDEFKKCKTALLTKEAVVRMESADFDNVEGEQDPPAFSKARIKSRKLAENQTDRDSQQFSPLEKDSDDEESQDMREDVDMRQYNIPNTDIVKEAEEIEIELNRAENQQSSQLSQFIEKKESSLTERQNPFKRERQHDLREKQTLSEISDSEIDNLLLTENEQQNKKKMWLKINKSWVDKQGAREQNANRVIKKRRKRTKDDPSDAKDAVEAITSSKLKQKNINPIEVRKLLIDIPVKMKSKVDKVFDAYAYQESNDYMKTLYQQP